MKKYATILCLIFALSPVHAYIIQTECWNKDVENDDPKYDLLDFYIVCDDGHERVLSGYSPVYQFGDLKYRKYFRIDRDGRHYKTGVSVRSDEFSDIESRDHEGYLHINSREDSKAILIFYRNNLYSFMECLSDFNCIESILDGIGFFDRYFNRDFLLMKKGYREAADTSDFYSSLKGVSLSSNDQLLMTMHFKNQAWRLTFDFSGRKPELAAFGEIIR